MKLTQMSRLTRLPVSTLYDRIKMYKDEAVVRKYASLLRFDRLGFHARAIIAFAAKGKDKEKLFEILNSSWNVNSLYKINNGFDFMAEALFPGVREVEEFLESIEEKVMLKKKKVLYVLKELKKEEFLSSPQRQMLGGFENEN